MPHAPIAGGLETLDAALAPPLLCEAMRRLLALSLAQPAAVLGLAVAFAIAGAIAFWHLPSAPRAAGVA